jgi:predicted Zn finger-like uncharacterized protein
LYTRCPHCLTVFVVAAEQLKAAHGNVRCGTCLESFDAIPHLSDEPVQTRSVDPVEHQDLGLELTDDAQRELATGIYGDRGHADARIASERLSSTLKAARAVSSVDDERARVPDPGPALEADESAGEALSDGEPPDSESPRTDAGNATVRRVSLLHESRPDAHAALPNVLRADAEELAARTDARRRTIGYGSAAIALLVLLAAQYIYFMPEDAARRYPQWRSAIESVCVPVGCVLPERRDPARIRVVSRDVRVHPRYEGVMQIKATLRNSAPYRQPYPKVRFTLFNVNGQTIATRVFRPAEYLGRPVDAGARLRPQTQFQVELDVLAPEEAAVSFEFSFS